MRMIHFFYLADDERLRTENPRAEVRRLKLADEVTTQSVTPRRMTQATAIQPALFQSRQCRW